MVSFSLIIKGLICMINYIYVALSFTSDNRLIPPFSLQKNKINLAGYK